MNRLAVLAVLAAVPVALAAPSARAADPARLVAAARALERGAYLETPETLVQARAEFEALSDAEPKSAALHAWMATAAWRLVPRIKDAKQAERHCKDGIAHADQALAIDPRHAEALALKASLQGMSLRFDPGAMMTLGPELEAHMGRALQLGPGNPRVLLLDALNTYNKPAFVGGGAGRALPKFRRALRAFDAAAPVDSTAPAWGRSDALIWAGRAAAALEDVEAARDFYQRALAIDPRNDWVRHALLPALDRADSSAAGKRKS